ncbi:MAG: hypothetical protein AB8G95_01325 [Anaerolineae bacterium]
MLVNFSRTKTYLFIFLISSVLSIIFVQNDKVFADEFWWPTAFPSQHGSTIYSISASVKKGDFNDPTFYSVRLYAVHNDSKEAGAYAKDQLDPESLAKLPMNWVNEISGYTENGHWKAGIYNVTLNNKELYVAVVRVQSPGNSSFTITKLYNSQAEAEEGAKELATQWLGGVIDPCHHYPESCGEVILR